MSAAPIDRLYGLLPRDQMSGLWGPRFTTGVQGAAAVSLEIGGPGTRLEVPPDYNYFLTRVTTRMIPGATQAVTEMEIEILGYESAMIFRLGSANFAGTADKVENYEADVDVCLVGGVHSILQTTTFDAGVNSNSVRFNTAGYYIPKGNISQF